MAPDAPSFSYDRVPRSHSPADSELTHEGCPACPAFPACPGLPWSLPWALAFEIWDFLLVEANQIPECVPDRKG